MSRAALVCLALLPGLGCSWQVERSIEIQASPAVVWSVLSDLEAYDEWNSYSPSAEGELAPGGVVTIEARLGEEVRRVDNRVTRVEPERSLCWHSMNWFEFLVRGTRCRDLEPSAAGTRLRHHEVMEGPLAGLIKWVYRPRIEAGLEQMNADLKRAAEAR